MRIDAQTPLLVGRSALTAAGPNMEALWRAVCERRDGLNRLDPTPYDTSGFRGDRACWLPKDVRERYAGPDPSDGRAPRLSAASRLLIDQLLLALDDALHGTLAERYPDRRRWGLWVGTTLGGIRDWSRQHGRVVADPDQGGTPSLVLRNGHGYAAPARDAARHLGIGGPVRTICTACCSATVATAEAGDALRRGQVDVAIAAGVDVLCRFVHAGFEILGALSKNEQRPFAATRDGLWLGEGAGVVVMVRAADAWEADGEVSQRPRPRVALAGGGLAGDALRLTGPDPEGGGVLRAARQALRQAGIDTEDLQAISAHGTATVLNDDMELVAIEALLGARAADVPVHAIKPVIGHTLGAAGIFEILILERAMQEGRFPGTPGDGPDDPKCRIHLHRGDPLERDLHSALTINSAFAGNNAALVLGRAE